MILALLLLLAVPDSLHLRFNFTPPQIESSCCCVRTHLEPPRVSKVRVHWRVISQWPTPWQPILEDSAEYLRDGTRAYVDVAIPALHTWAGDSTARMVQLASSRWSKNLAAEDSAGVTVLRRVSLWDACPWRRGWQVRPR